MTRTTQFWTPPVPSMAQMIETVGIDPAAASVIEESKTKAWLDRYPDLVVSEAIFRKRFIPQPAFKLPFDNTHDIDLRLRHTLIYVGPRLYSVRQVMQYKKEFFLILDSEDRSQKIPYSHPAVDLRGPEPQYISYRRAPYYFFRVSKKQQQQGVNSNNAVIKQCGNPYDSVSRVDNPGSLIAGFGDLDERLEWNTHYSALMLGTDSLPALKLSPFVAVFREGPSLFLEYRGRSLGKLEEDTVSLTQRDQQPWITREIARVGCNVRAV